MKIQYFPDTDTLYIKLSDTTIANTDMITDSLIVDFDASEKVVGITVEQASVATDVSAVEAIINALPVSDFSSVEVKTYESTL